MAIIKEKLFLLEYKFNTDACFTIHLSSLEVASQKENENKVLKQKLREYEILLKERVHSGRRYSRDTER